MTVFDISRIQCALDEEPAPRQIPVELEAAELIIGDLEEALRCFKEIRFAMQLSFDSDDPITDKQRAAAARATDVLVDGIRLYGPDFR